MRVGTRKLIHIGLFEQCENKCVSFRFLWRDWQIVKKCQAKAIAIKATIWIVGNGNPPLDIPFRSVVGYGVIFLIFCSIQSVSSYKWHTWICKYIFASIKFTVFYRQNLFASSCWSISLSCRGMNIVLKEYQFKIFKLKNFLAIIVLNKFANYWWNFFCTQIVWPASVQIPFCFFFLPLKLKRLCQQLKFFWKEGIFPT